MSNEEDLKQLIISIERFRKVLLEELKSLERQKLKEEFEQNIKDIVGEDYELPSDQDMPITERMGEIAGNLESERKLDEFTEKVEERLGELGDSIKESEADSNAGISMATGGATSESFGTFESSKEYPKIHSLGDDMVWDSKASEEDILKLKDNFKEVWYNYQEGAYEGSAFIVARDGKDWYYGEGGHCSCYGPIDINFDYAGPYSFEAIKKIAENYGNEAKTVTNYIDETMEEDDE